MKFPLMTWDNLLRKGWKGPNIYHLCCTEVETVQHLLVECPFSVYVRRLIFDQLGLVHSVGTDTLRNVIADWIKHGEEPGYLLFFCCWALWLCRNAWIFSGIKPSAHYTAICVLDLVATFPSSREKNKVRNIRLGPQCYNAMGFFDGAATSTAGGARAVLYISYEHHFLIRLGCGLCTNSRSELLALFCLLHVTNVMALPGIPVYGDSMMVIDWVKGRSKLKVTNLEHWCNRIADLEHGFSFFDCQHIYREHNSLANRLSKLGLGEMDGLIHFEFWHNSTLSSSGSLVTH